MSKISRSLLLGSPVALIALTAALVAKSMTVAPETDFDPAPNSSHGDIVVAATEQAQFTTLPSLTGSFPVGRTELALVDTNRIDAFADDGRRRELAVWIWYPAVESTGAPATYLPLAWADVVGNVGPLMQDVSLVRTNSMADARMEGRPPVVVLLPGLGHPVVSYASLAEDLASHGYVVVGINPTELTQVVFPDGHVVGPTALGGIDENLISDVAAWYAAAERVTDVWAADAKFVVETLAANPPQIGALDFEHVAYIGHSLGGAAAFEACRNDTFCAGAVDLDGTLWTEVRHSGLQAPTLVLRQAASDECDAFCVQANIDFGNVLMAGNSEQFRIAGSKHLSFTDLGLMPGPGNNEYFIGSIAADRMNLIVRDMVESFLDVHVRHSPEAIFAAATARYSELQLP